MTSRILGSRFFASSIATVLLATQAIAQFSESMLPSWRADGTVWAQTLGVKLSSGSAELGSIDMGPPGPPVSGVQAAWLEWTPQHVYAGGMSSSTFSNELFDPSTGFPIAGCAGVATLNGGWIISSFGGPPSSIRPHVGAFLWTPAKLFLTCQTGPIATTEVFDPSGGSILNVQGVAVIHSYIWDYSTTPGVVNPAIVTTALVYTPMHVYQVLASLSGAPVYSIGEVFTPFGAPITTTRGISVVAGDIDTSFFPPFDVQGAAFIWNPTHVYLFTKTPAPAVVEVMNTSGIPLTGCWGVMRMGPGLVNPTRAAAQVWQTARSWLVRLDPGITITEATAAPGTPVDPPIVSGVNVPAGGLPLVERQCSYLFEIMGSMTTSGVLRRALIVGCNQRMP